MKKKVVGNVPGVEFGMLEDLICKWRKGAITTDQVEMFLKGKNPFEKSDDLLEEWHKFYAKYFETEPDFSGLVIPKKRKGFDRLLIVNLGMTPQPAFDACAKRFPCWKYTDKSLDEVINFAFQKRSARERAYAIWVRDRVEADEELKNKSANQLDKIGDTQIQLDERLLYELKFYDETGAHLDMRNITLCAGSRYLDGDVPFVDWSSSSSKLRVNGDSPSGSCDGRRSRQVS